MRHAYLDRAGPRRAHALDDRDQHGNQNVQALDGEALLAQVGSTQESLEAFHRGQALEQELLLGRARMDAMLAGLDCPPEPFALLVAVDVLDFEGDRPAVGRAQLGQDLAQRGAGYVHIQLFTRDSRQTRFGQPPARWIECFVAGRRAAQRVEVRGAVAETAEGSNQIDTRGDFRRVGGWSRRGRGDLDRRRDDRLGYAQAIRDGFIEPVRAAQETLEGRQETARFGALDDAVVVGAAYRHDRAAIDVADRAGSDDRALAGHQAWDRGGRADGTRVRQGHVRARQIVRHEAVGTSASYEVVVAADEGAEVELVGCLQDRNDQERLAVAPQHVDGETECDRMGVHPMRFAVDLDEVRGQGGMDRGRLGNRVSDQVGQRKSSRGYRGVDL